MRNHRPRPTIRIFLCAVALALLAPTVQANGQGVTSTASAVQPAALPADQPAYKLLDGVPYRTVDGQILTCDLYVPQGEGPFPTVLFVHGGGWSGGDRKQLRRQASFLAERGFFGMAIDYRLAPAYPSPASFEDAQAAVVWLRSHASQYHLDPNRIAAVGSSAGGHLAAMLGVSSGPQSNPATKVEAVVSFNGIFDLNTMPPSAMVEKFIGSPCSTALDRCKSASPIAYVQSGLPPFLILHGTADKTAPYAQATSMVATLQAAHDSATLFTADGAPHTFWAQDRWMNPSFDAMYQFLVGKIARRSVTSPAH
jgi:acetyl esterase/lipase